MEIQNIPLTSTQNVSQANPSQEVKISNEKPSNKDTSLHEKQLTEALSFLFSKDSSDIPLQTKKEFLLLKLPSDIVEEAFNIYPKLKNSIDSSNKALTSSFTKLYNSLFDIGIITSSLLISLLINYILDINREKKNAYFQTQFQTALTSQFNSNINALKTEINQVMDTYITTDKLSTEISGHLEQFSKGKGWTVNPSWAKVKNDIETMQHDIINLNSKIENSSLWIMQSMKLEIKTAWNEYFMSYNNINVRKDVKRSTEDTSEALLKSELMELLEKIDDKKGWVNQLIQHFGLIIDNEDENVKINLQSSNYNGYDKTVLSSVLKKCGMVNYNNSTNVYSIDKTNETQRTELVKSINCLKEMIN